MSKRRSRKKNRRLPPLLARLIWAAKQAKEDSGGGDISPVPGALKEFGAMAQWVVPAHGAFLGTRDEVAMVVERAAKLRFGGGEAKRQFEEALRVVDDSHDRDTIETAVGAVRMADNDAYFYAGLACGITLASMPGGR